MERKNRYLIKITRCMLIDTNFNNKYCKKVVVTTNYLQNRLSIKKMVFQEIRFKNYSYFCKKLDHKTKELLFAEYSSYKSIQIFLTKIQSKSR